MLTETQLTVFNKYIGKAYNSIYNEVGDVNKKRSLLYKLESIFTKLHGSNEYHDIDIASQFNTYGIKDTVDLSLLQTKIISSKSDPFIFPLEINNSGWVPDVPGPPTIEGWHTHYYGAWKNYATDFQGNVLSNPDELSYALRQNLNGPIRWTGSVYNRVPLIENARWISFRNNTQSNLGSSSSIAFKLNLNDFIGYKIKSANETIKDLIICYYPQLVQSVGANGWIPINQANLPISNPPQPPSYLAYEYDIINSEFYIVINIPSDLSIQWNNGSWFHVLFYWGSKDSILEQYISSNVPTYLQKNNIIFESVDIIKHPKKNFFIKESFSGISVSNTRFEDWINNYNFKLKAINRTNYSLKDGQYSQLVAPDYYNFPLTLPNLDTQNILGDIFQKNKKCFVSVILMIKILGDNNSLDIKFKLGPIIPPEYTVCDWSTFKFFPKEDLGYLEIARFIISSPSKELFDTPVSSSNGSVINSDNNTDYNQYRYILNKYAICWTQNSIANFTYPIGDKNLSKSLLPKLKSALDSLRNIRFYQPLIDLCYSTIADSIGVDISIYPIDEFLNSSNLASVSLHNLIKHPENSNMPIAIDSNMNSIINKFSGQSASMDFIKFTSNHLEILPENYLISPNQFEIYMMENNPSDILDRNSAGNRLELDYTLRIVFNYDSENTLTKDLFVMASKYYLSEEEFSRRVNASEAIAGYFNINTIQNINEFRINGYAGLIPDLSSGQSRTILTKVVSPLDTTKITENQFRKNLENQGQTISQIDEAVKVYSEDGGEFYTIDLNQYSNQFVGVSDCAMTVTKYSYSINNYWIDKLDSMPYYSDSFTIACGNTNPVGYFESGYSNNNIKLENSNYDSDFNFKYDTNKFSAKITTPNLIGTFNRLNIKIKLNSNIINKSIGKLNVYLYSNNIQNNPDLNLCYLGSISLSNLSTSYDNFILNFSYALSPNNIYWIVCEKDSNALSDLSINNTSVLFKIQQSNSISNLQTLNNLTWNNYLGLINFELYNEYENAIGSFRRAEHFPDYFPPQNNKRVIPNVYNVESDTSWRGSNIYPNKNLYVYPRAIKINGVWTYVPNNNVYYVVVKYIANGIVENNIVKINIGTITPTIITKKPISKLVYLGVYKTSDKQNVINFNLGAPINDNFIIRSV